MKPERLTSRQAAILGAFTGYLCGPFEDLQAYAEEKLGPGIGPVGMAAMERELRAASCEDFQAICAPMRTLDAQEVPLEA